MTDYTQFPYPWNIIADYFDKISDSHGHVKKLEYIDDSNRIQVYCVGTGVIRIDVQKNNEQGQ